MTTRVYSSISVETILSASITSSQTSIAVATGTASALLGGAPLTPAGTYQFTLALDPDTVNEEIVFATYISGDTFTVTRGGSGTSPITHASGATVRHVLTSNDLDYFNTAIQPATLTAKGDMYIATASGVVTRLGVGTDGQVLTADSTTTKGAKWDTPASLPSQTGNSGKYLTTNGTAASWANAVPTLDITFNSQTGTTYTLQSTDINKMINLSNSSAITVTVPNGVFTTGQVVNLRQTGTGQVTVQSDGTTTITGTGTALRTQYSAASLLCTGSNAFTLIGDIA